MKLNVIFREISSLEKTEHFNELSDIFPLLCCSGRTGGWKLSPSTAHPGSRGSRPRCSEGVMSSPSSLVEAGPLGSWGPRRPLRPSGLLRRGRRGTGCPTRWVGSLGGQVSREERQSQDWRLPQPLHQRSPGRSMQDHGSRCGKALTG